MIPQITLEKGKEIEGFLSGLIVNMKMQEGFNLRTNIGYLHSNQDVCVDILLMNIEFGSITVYYRGNIKKYEVGIYPQMEDRQWVELEFDTFEDCKKCVIDNYQLLVDSFKYIYEWDEDDI